MPDLIFQRSDEHALEEIMPIEQRAYPFPWSKQQFLDCLTAGYEFYLVRENRELVGYFMVQCILDELHILNLCVMPDRQGQGHGHSLLDYIVLLAEQKQMNRLLLEVRRSNKVARFLYQSKGFETIGIRKKYYPAGDNQREDAIVMEYLLG